MLSSASRKLRFWKKQPDKKKELTAEDEALLNEIEQQSRIINNLKQECTRLEGMKSDLEQYKAKYEALEKKMIQQAINVEKHQTKLQVSLKVAEEEIQKLSDDLMLARTVTCGKCEVRKREHKRYTLEICRLQDTIVKLERENKILQSLVKGYASQASKSPGKMHHSFFGTSKLQRKLEDRHETDASSQTTKMASSVEGERIRRSSLSLNDFLDDSIDDIQSEKFEVDKSSGCSSLDEDQKELGGSEILKSTQPVGRKKGLKYGKDDDLKMRTIESFMANSQRLTNSESLCDTSDVFSSTNFSSVTSNSLHDLSSDATTLANTMEDRVYSNETVHIDDYKTKSTNNFKNSSAFSEQILPNNCGLRKSSNSNSSPHLCVEDFGQSQHVYNRRRHKNRKRKSLDDPKTLTRLYLQNKSGHTELQKVVRYFQSEGNNDVSHDGDTKHVVITKDKVAALRRYFEKEDISVSCKFPGRHILSKKNSKVTEELTTPRAVQTPKNLLKTDSVLTDSASRQKLNSIPRLSAFPHLAKAKVSNTKNGSSNFCSPNPKLPALSLHPRQSRDIRSASVPSPILTNKCNETSPFKIAFTKATSLKSFNNFAVNNKSNKIINKSEKIKLSEATKSNHKKACGPSKQNTRDGRKPWIIADIDKYKLNLAAVRENAGETPVVVVDVSEDISDSCVSNDETSACGSSTPSVVFFPSQNVPANTNAVIQIGKSSSRMMDVKQVNGKSPPKVQNVVSCNCRSKSHNSKEASKIKTSAVRTNGSMVQKTQPMSKKSTSATTKEQKNVHDSSYQNKFLIQKDDSKTNQTFFCEISSQEKCSLIPTKKSPMQINRTGGAQTRTSKATPLTCVPEQINTKYFSPEKFILKSGHGPNRRQNFNGSSVDSKPVSKKIETTCNSQPKTSTPNNVRLSRNIALTPQDTPTNTENPTQFNQEKLWPRFKKVETKQNPSSIGKPNKADSRIQNSKKSERTDRVQHMTNSNTGQTKNEAVTKTGGHAQISNNFEFENISTQLDNLTLTVKNLHEKQSSSSIF